MFRFFISLLLILEVDMIRAHLSITKIVVRVPKEDDIGLIFDLCVVNTQSNKKETLDFHIRSDGACSLNLTNNVVMEDAGRIVGGYFGYIESGTIETISLIWPTVSLFNRVGSCPIVLTSTNPKNEQVSTKQIVHFDTRFTTLDPDSRSLRKRPGYKDCNNWDKEYLRNCTPVNCEERYFGRRSFYNHSTQHCEEVARCAESYEVYDTYANECIDTKNICTEEDIENIRRGKFEENILNLSETKKAPNIVVNQGTEDTLDSLGVLKHPSVRQTGDADPSSGLPYWLKGLADGLLIVFATIAIYVLICFIIFLIVSWLSRRQTHSGSKCLLHTPSSSEGNLPLYTHSSLLSQR